jgi:hypothetical protein
MKREGKESKKIKLTRETLKNLSKGDLTRVNGGARSGVACYASDLSALFGVTTTGGICPN